MKGHMTNEEVQAEHDEYLRLVELAHSGTQVQSTNEDLRDGDELWMVSEVEPLIRLFRDEAGELYAAQKRGGPVYFHQKCWRTVQSMI